MEPKRTAKWIAHYRLLTSLSLVAGVAVFVAGLYLGLSQAVSVLLGTTAGNPLEALSAAVAAARPLPALGGLLGGLLVWRIGQAAAFYSTTRKVVDDRIEDHIEEKLGPAIEEELERQVEFRVEEVLANRENGNVNNMFAESSAGDDTATSTAASTPRSSRNGGAGTTTDDA